MFVTLVSFDCHFFRVLMVSPVPEASRVSSARKETKDPEDSLDLLVQLVCRCVEAKDIQGLFVSGIRRGHD